MVNIGDINFVFWDHLGHEAGKIIIILIVGVIVAMFSTLWARRVEGKFTKASIWSGIIIFLIFGGALSSLSLSEADGIMRKEAVQQRVQSYYNLGSPFSTWEADKILNNPDEYVVIRENQFSDDADGLRKYDIAARYDSDTKTVTLYVPVEEGKQEYTELEPVEG